MKGITVGQDYCQQQGRQRVEGPWPEGDGEAVWDTAKDGGFLGMLNF